MLAEYVSMEKLFECDDLWVFAYGSLIWNPGFEYVQNLIGFVEDVSRKFWQGNTTHRGRPENPGRVVTLIQDKGARVWGKAYHVVGRDQVAYCQEQLGLRECLLGGYDIRMMNFTPQDHAWPVASTRGSKHPELETDQFKNSKTETIKTLTFIALPENKLFLGPASTDEMADCLLRCEGPNGRNLDYMLGILEFLRFKVPQEELIFEREILDIDRTIWNRLEREGFEAVSGCRGFFVENIDQAELDRSKTRCYMNSQSIDFKFKNSNKTKVDVAIRRSFSPLLDLAREMELEMTLKCHKSKVVEESLSDSLLSDSLESLDDSSVSSETPPSPRKSDWRKDFPDKFENGYDSDYASS